MCMGGSPSTPPPPPVAPPPVQGQDAAMTQSRDAERRRQAAQAGRASTILTGAQGAATPTGQGKTLLGA